MKTYLKRAALVVCIAAIVFASGGFITLISTNQVSNEAWSGYRWTPASAVGSSSWVTGWTSYTTSALVGSFLSNWTSGWNAPVQLIPPNGLMTGDVHIAWDAVRNRFVFVVIDLPGFGNSNVWYGFSNDSLGSSWTISSTPVFSATTADWDYPSIGVDASGRVIVGAVGYPGPSGFYSSVSTDGITFSAPAFIGGGGTAPGSQSRIVATNSLFEAFIPTLNGSFLPTAVDRYESTNGTTWTGPFSVATFGAPLNNTPVSPPVFYAPLLDAKGYTNGLWTVVFPINNGGYNNIYICTSNRGCGIVDAASNDQFLGGTSVSADQGYWIHYLSYTGGATRTLPLITRAVYLPPSLPGIGATTNTGIDPTSWLITTRCLGLCYAAGDYNTISSNPFAAASTPLLRQSARQTDLFQSFIQDPPEESNLETFVPRTVIYAMGADLSSLGQPVPPQAGGIPPDRRKGVPQAPEAGVVR